MDLYFFPSESWENINIGVKSCIWGILKPGKPEMRRQFTTKALKMPIGAHGMFYISGVKMFTTPFIVASKPDPEGIIDNVWDGEFILPFRIHPLSDAWPSISRRELRQLLPSLCDTGEQWDMRIRIKANQYFVPSKLSIRDWEALVEKLAPAGEVQLA